MERGNRNSAWHTFVTKCYTKGGPNMDQKSVTYYSNGAWGLKNISEVKTNSFNFSRQKNNKKNQQPKVQKGDEILL